MEKCEVTHDDCDDLEEVLNELFENTHFDETPGDWRTMPETEPPDDEDEDYEPESDEDDEGSDED